MGDRKVFADSIVALPEHDGVTAHGLIVNQAKPENRNERMDLLFSLDIPAQADLEQRVAKGEVLSADELSKYAPKSSDVDALKQWLAGQGFKVTGQSPDGSSVYASATVNQIGFSVDSRGQAPSTAMSLGSTR